MRLHILFFLAALFGITASSTLFAQDKTTNTSQRVALVIGNAAYKESALRNPVNDARAIAKKLRGLGFSVITRENASQKDMTRAITEFGEKLAPGGVGLFFYAGHGMQVQGRNLLVPVDAQIRSEGAARSESVDVEMVLAQMPGGDSSLNIVILDACRNNPFERRFRSNGSGLAAMDAPTGTLLAYSTAPGKVASDGDGANGLYTSELLRALDLPGLKVEDVFKKVRVQVAKISKQAQVPWEASSLTGDFYFLPSSATPAQTAIAPPAKPNPPSINDAAMEKALAACRDAISRGAHARAERLCAAPELASHPEAEELRRRAAKAAEETREAQDLLGELGYFTGEHDGNASPAFLEARRAFERDSGKKYGDRISPAFLQALRAERDLRRQDESRRKQEERDERQRALARCETAYNQGAHQDALHFCEPLAAKGVTGAEQILSAARQKIQEREQEQRAAQARELRKREVRECQKDCADSRNDLSDSQQQARMTYEAARNRCNMGDKFACNSAAIAAAQINFNRQLAAEDERRYKECVRQCRE